MTEGHLNEDIMNRKRLMVLGLAAALWGPAGIAAQDQGAVTSDSTALVKGRQYTQWWYEQEFETLWEAMGAQMRQALGGSVEGLSGVRQQVDSYFGEETELVSEDVTRAQGMFVYIRRARYSGYEGLIQLQFAMDEAGMITGFFVRPAQ